MKAERNKTIDITVEEGKEYLDRCLKLEGATLPGDILNKTILGDTFEVLPLLPEGFADLVIVDPPYNLDKDFNGKKFKKTSDELYEEYTEKWVSLVAPLLKDTGSIYVCCDWKSGSAIERVLKRYFHIQNRITW